MLANMTNPVLRMLALVTVAFLTSTTMKFFSAAALAPWALFALSSVESASAVPGMVKRQSSSSSSSSAASAVSPLTPGLTNEGSPLLIQWDTTTNQAWKSMEIKFMTGSNQNMTELYTVATDVDGTSAGAGKLLWTAPNVEPNSGIYFFQFTHDGEDPTWTTRFAIADTTGAVTAPPNARQPEGPAIPWGVGRIVSAASAASSSSPSSASASGSAAANTASASSALTSSSSSASAGSSTSASTSSTSSSSNSAQTGNSSGSNSQTTSGSTSTRAGSAALVGCAVAAVAGSLLF